MTRTLILALGFVFFWNSGFIGAEYALPNTGPFTLLFWRYGCLAAVLGAYLSFRRALRWPGWAEALRIGGIGILAHGVWLGCVLVALDRDVPAGIVALVVALQPLVTGTFSGVVTGESTSPIRWAGLATGFVGVGIAVVARADFADAGSVLAYLIPFGSVVAITAATLDTRRRELNREGVALPVTVTLFYQSLGTAAAVALPAIWSERLATDWTPFFVAAMLWLVLAVSLLAYALMWLLVARIDATRVASLFYLGPPVTMLMAWAAFGDRLIATDVVGLGVVLAGVVMTQMPWGAAPGAPPSAEPG